MAKRWYVVHAYSGFEKHVMRTLKERVALEGMEDKFGEILVPTEEVVEVVRGKKKTVEKRYFPGYVLLKAQLTDATNLADAAEQQATRRASTCSAHPNMAPCPP